MEVSGWAIEFQRCRVAAKIASRRPDSYTVKCPIAAFVQEPPTSRRLKESGEIR